MTNYEPVDRVFNHGGIRALLWPWGGFSIVAFFTSTLSMVSLIYIVSEMTPSDFIEILIATYDRLIGRALGWIATLTEFLFSFIGIHIQISAEWKHVFILLSLYFSAGAWAEKKAGHLRLAIARGGIGLAIALAASLAVGAFFNSGDWWSNFTFAFVPALATALNDTLLIVYRYGMKGKNFRPSMKWISIRTFSCFIAAIIIPILMSENRNSGLIALFCVILIHLLNQIRLSIVEMRIWKTKSPSAAWHDLFLQSKSGLMASRIINVLIFAFVTIIIDIGWENAPWQ